MSTGRRITSPAIAGLPGGDVRDFRARTWRAVVSSVEDFGAWASPYGPGWRFAFGVGAVVPYWGFRSDGEPDTAHPVYKVDRATVADLVADVEAGGAWADALARALANDRQANLAPRDLLLGLSTVDNTTIASGSPLELSHEAPDVDTGGGVSGGVRVIEFLAARGDILEAVRATAEHARSALRLAEPPEVRSLRNEIPSLTVEDARELFARRLGLSSTEAQQLRISTMPNVLRDTSAMLRGQTSALAALARGRGVQTYDAPQSDSPGSGAGASMVGASSGAMAAVSAPKTVVGIVAGGLVGGILGRVLTGSLAGAAVGAGLGGVAGGGVGYALST